jgi:hypothetical protein
LADFGLAAFPLPQNLLFLQGFRRIIHVLHSVTFSKRSPAFPNFYAEDLGWH